MPVIDPLVLVRGIHFAATLGAAGTVSFIVLVAGPARRLTWMVWAALAVAVLSGLAWLALVAANIQDVTLIEILLDSGLWPVVTGTRFGQVACLRFGLALVLGLLMAAPVRLPGRQALRLAAAAGLVGLLAFVGHAGATPSPAGWIHLASDLIHVLAAAAWLGGLPALALTLSAAPPSDAVAATARFSLLGIACVVALLVSGLVNSWQLLGGPGDLLATAYGRVLSAKIALFAVMVGIAAVNRFSLTPRLPDVAAIRVLRRNSIMETAIGLAVVMLVGSLGMMVPAGHMRTNAAPVTSEAAFVHIHTEAVMADVTIAPGGGGGGNNNTVTIRLSREDYSLYAARDVTLALEPREAGQQPIERTAAPIPDGTWQIENLVIPRAGVWILRLTIRAGNADPLVLDAPIVITQCSNECW